jgi:hypothetical protein
MLIDDRAMKDPEYEGDEIISRIDAWLSIKHHSMTESLSHSTLREGK